MWAATALLAELRRPSFISRQFRHILETTLETFDKVPLKRSLRRSQPIVVPQAIFSSVNKARPAEVCQMTRGRGLRNLNDACDISHAEFPTKQEPQNPQTRTIRKSPKH